MSGNVQGILSQNRSQIDGRTPPARFGPSSEPLPNTFSHLSDKHAGEHGASTASSSHLEAQKPKTARDLYLDVAAGVQIKLHSFSLSDRLKLWATGVDILRTEPSLSYTEGSTTMFLLNYGLKNTASSKLPVGFDIGNIYLVIADYLSQTALVSGEMDQVGGWPDVQKRILRLSYAASFSGRKRRDIAPHFSERLQAELKKGGYPHEQTKKAEVRQLIDLVQLEGLGADQAHKVYCEIMLSLKSKFSLITLEARLKLYGIGAKLLNLYPELASKEVAGTFYLINYGLNRATRAMQNSGVELSSLANNTATYFSHAVSARSCMQEDPLWDRTLLRIRNLSAAATFKGKKYKEIPSFVYERLETELDRAGFRKRKMPLNQIVRELKHTTMPLPARSGPTTFIVPPGTFHKNEAEGNQSVSRLRLIPNTRQDFEEIVHRVYRYTDGLRTGKTFVRPEAVQRDAEFIEGALFTIGQRWLTEDMSLGRRTVNNLLHSVIKLDGSSDLSLTGLKLLKAAVQVLVLSPDLLKTWDFPQATFKRLTSSRRHDGLIASFARETIPKLEELRQKALIKSPSTPANSPYLRSAHASYLIHN